MLPFPLRFIGNWKNAHTMTIVMLKWNWRKTSHVHADLDMVATARGFCKFPDQLNNNGLNPPLTAIPCLNLFIYAFSKSRAVCIRVFHSIWMYQMKRFIWGTRTFCATGVSVEWRSQKRLGGGGGSGGIFPREIFMIGLSKMQFPTFSGSQLVNQKGILRQ